MNTHDFEPLLSVVVMAFNEEQNLRSAVCEIHDELRDLNQPFELIIVNDGSTDGTGLLAHRLSEELHGLRVVDHADNRGLGEAYRTGFAEARGTYVTFFPADGQFPATIIGQFLPLMKECDLVLGYVPERKVPWLTKVLSKIERWLYRVLFGPIPRFDSIMMFRRCLLEKIPLKSSGRSWVVVWEFVLRVGRGPYQIKSDPTTMRPRISGRSKVNNLRNILSHLKHMLVLYRSLGK